MLQRQQHQRSPQLSSCQLPTQATAALSAGPAAPAAAAVSRAKWVRQGPEQARQAWSTPARLEVSCEASTRFPVCCWYAAVLNTFHRAVCLCGSVPYCPAGTLDWQSPGRAAACTALHPSHTPSHTHSDASCLHCLITLSCYTPSLTIHTQSRQSRLLPPLLYPVCQHITTQTLLLLLPVPCLTTHATIHMHTHTHTQARVTFTLRRCGCATGCLARGPRLLPPLALSSLTCLCWRLRSSSHARRARRSQSSCTTLR